MDNSNHSNRHNRKSKAVTHKSIEVVFRKVLNLAKATETQFYEVQKLVRDPDGKELAQIGAWLANGWRNDLDVYRAA